jgi:hypothetical protein
MVSASSKSKGNSLKSETLKYISMSREMNNRDGDDGSRKVKNIAAILYLVVLVFLVGGSYINQQNHEKPTENIDKRQ